MNNTTNSTTPRARSGGSCAPPILYYTKLDYTLIYYTVLYYILIYYTLHHGEGAAEAEEDAHGALQAPGGRCPRGRRQLRPRLGVRAAPRRDVEIQSAILRMLRNLRIIRLQIIMIIIIIPRAPARDRPGRRRLPRTWRTWLLTN